MTFGLRRHSGATTALWDCAKRGALSLDHFTIDNPRETH